MKDLELGGLSAGCVDQVHRAVTEAGQAFHLLFYISRPPCSGTSSDQ